MEHNIEIEDENQLAELNEFLLYKRPRAKKELIPRQKSVDSDEEESDEEERSEAFEEDAGNDEDHVEKDLCEDDSPKI